MNGWTPERRLRQSQLIQQWKPWAKSTGAKTPKGKAISKMNARKFGLYDAEIMRNKKLIALYGKRLIEIQKIIF